MTPSASRHQLLSLLAEACELEHALACSYLFAAFSIRRDIGPGVSWEDQQRNRRWASQLYHVAAQEMLHLGQAWNLMTAVGGAPHVGRPQFPQAARTFPLPVALLLRRFDRATLDRFLHYESPAHESDTELVPPPPGAVWPIDDNPSQTSVGALYAECGRLIDVLGSQGDLFVGAADHQLGAALVHFPDIIEVRDRQSALDAIERITVQGEGTREEREDSHFGVFRAVRVELEEIADEGTVSHPVGDNPYVRRRPENEALFGNRSFCESAITTTLVDHPTAILGVDLFDDVYALMLDALAYLFSNATADSECLAVFSRVSLELMVTVVKPLGEALCQMPSGTEGVNAGPAFGLGRRIGSGPSPGVAQRLVRERLAGLAANARTLEALCDGLAPAARDQVWSAAHHLHRLSRVGEEP